MSKNKLFISSFGDTQDKHFSRITDKGFTFIELLIASFIILLILFVFSMSVVSFLESSQFSLQSTISLSDAQNGLRTITRFIREARVGDNGAYPLVTTNDTELIFFTDADNNASAEKVRFFLEGTTLKQGIIHASGTPPSYLSENEDIRIISSDVQNGETPLFYYYNSDWPEDTTNNPLPLASRLLNTRLVTVRLMIGTSNNPSDIIELTSSVQIRNLKDNL